ncbi:S-ribosylhomocysteine lyase [Candidatus Stoquefichus massiliensis]|uniref:S-ribosylhomocysteine lyase n=1 Tax=Candidatus Stoquefichus massiliensis TaxID=1470350 RepID=UPI000481CF8E|nr:S-ribosylhomocysteine lyase [Candidatus Stoquefichus massiliensis]
MERITSFCVNHTMLKKGIYISRMDEDLTTYDIRMCEPNIDEPLDPKAAHTIEHIGATLLRNGKYKDSIIYFGPMGCMTGFYLITKDLTFDEIKVLIKDIFTQISQWSNEIPGAKKEECGNYTYMNLNNAKKAAQYFIECSWEHEYHFL